MTLPQDKKEEISHILTTKYNMPSYELPKVNVMTITSDEMAINNETLKV